MKRKRLRQALALLLALALFGALPLSGVCAEVGEDAWGFALSVTLFKPVEPDFPYERGDFYYPVPEDFSQENEQEAQARRRFLPNGSYTPEYFGLEPEAVTAVVPAYALFSSMFYDPCVVYLKDASLLSALSALSKVQASPAVAGARIVSVREAEKMLKNGYQVLVMTDEDFATADATPDAFGEAVEQVEAHGENPAEFRYFVLTLKEPSRDTVISLIKSLSEKPFVQAAETDVGFSMDAFLVGDADMDGHVTAADARLVLRFAVGLEKPVYAYSASVAHTDGDRQYTAADARKILRVAVGLEREEFVS